MLRWLADTVRSFDRDVVTNVIRCRGIEPILTCICWCCLVTQLHTIAAQCLSEISIAAQSLGTRCLFSFLPSGWSTLPQSAKKLAAAKTLPAGVVKGEGWVGTCAPKATPPPNPSPHSRASLTPVSMP